MKITEKTLEDYNQEPTNGVANGKDTKNDRWVDRLNEG